jgi:hypothetical protein
VCVCVYMYVFQTRLEELSFQQQSAEDAAAKACDCFFILAERLLRHNWSWLKHVTRYPHHT